MYAMPVEVLAGILKSESKAVQTFADKKTWLHGCVEYWRALDSSIFLGKHKENTVPWFV